MFFFLIFLSASSFKYLKEAEINNAISGSILCPILIGFFSSNSSFSIDFSSKLKEIGDYCSDSIDVSGVNCSENTNICQKLSVFSTPSLKLYNTGLKNMNYEYKGPLVGSKIIDFVQKRIIKIKKQNFGFNSTENDYSVHSQVVCSTSIPQDIQSGLETLLPTFGHKLYYSKSSKKFIKIYMSKKCTKKYLGEIRFKNIVDFIYSNRFSHLHMFDYKEIINYGKIKPLVLYASRGNLTEKDFETLEDLSGYFCKSINFGWININNDEVAESMLHIESDEVSKLVFVDRVRKTVFKMNSPFNFYNAKSFIENIAVNFIFKDKETDPKWPIFLAFCLILGIFIVRVRYQEMYFGFLQWIISLKMPQLS